MTTIKQTQTSHLLTVSAGSAQLTLFGFDFTIAKAGSFLLVCTLLF